MHRYCNKCKNQLSSSLFNTRVKRGVRVIRSRCRLCEASDCKEWQSKNRDKYLLIKREYRESHKDLAHFYSRRARYLARSPEPVGNHTLDEWEELKTKYQYMCLCCKRYEPDIRLTPDHIIPISKRGTDSIENIQPLCMKCNQIKNNKIISYV